MKKIFGNSEGAGFLTAVILLITVLMATIIGAVIFFAFADATTTIDAYTDTHTIFHDGAKDEWVNLSHDINTDASWSAIVSNGTTSNTSANAVAYSANGTIKVPASDIDTGDTTITATYKGNAYQVSSSIVTYAITVFALLAIVPLIIVGGLMLRSLGFMGGGGAEFMIFQVLPSYRKKRK